jgi:hypothetical protein
MCLSSYCSERAPEGASLAERMDIQELRRLRDVFSSLGALTITNMNILHDYNNAIQSRTLKERDLYSEWYRLITTYSSCQLTHQTDILPAISGMASVFQSITNDTYVSGLWKNDLKRGLLWFAQHRDTTSRPSSHQYLGPSWSWTSIIAPRGIEYESTSASSPAIMSSSCCNIIHAKSAAMGRNPFGRAEGGELYVSGFLKEIFRPGNTDSVWSTWQEYCPEFPGLIIKFFMDVESEVAAGTKVFLFPVSVFLQGMRRATLDDGDGDDLQHWDVFERIVGQENGVNCLLLVPVDDTDQVYRRVGLVQTGALYCFRRCKKENLRIV